MYDHCSTSLTTLLCIRENVAVDWSLTFGLWRVTFVWLRWTVEYYSKVAEENEIDTRDLGNQVVF
jgi:hypothetical protein